MGVSDMHTSFTNPETQFAHAWKTIWFLERTLELDGRVAFELPAENQLWNNPQLLAFEEGAGLKRVYFNGCALNLKGKHDKYLKKPWCVTTSDLRMIQFLSQCQVRRFT